MRLWLTEKAILRIDAAMMVSPDVDDTELVRRIATGDMDAYRVLVTRHINRGIKVAERMLGNRQDAEDVVQEACLKILRSAASWEPRAKFSTWFLRVVSNACLDRCRQRQSYIETDLALIEDERLNAEQYLLAEETTSRVKAAIGRLPERQRLAVILCYYEELSNRDAADIMNIMLGAFQQLLFRARQQLRLELLETQERVDHA